MTTSALYESGTFANRPAPDVRGRIYEATDTGDVYIDTGAAWIDMATVSLVQQEITANGYSPTLEGIERVSRYYISGTLRAYTRTNHLVDFSNFSMRRIQIALNDAPSGVDGSNHFNVNVTDGTTSVDVPVDSDALVHEGAISTPISRYSGTNDTGGGYNVRTAWGTSITPSATQTIDQIGFLTRQTGTRNVSAHVYDMDAGQTVSQSSTAGYSMSTGTYTYVTIPAVEMVAGTQYWFGWTCDSMSFEYSTSGSYTPVGCTWHGGGHQYSYPSLPAPNTSVRTFFALRSVTYPEFTNVPDRELTITVTEVGTAPADPGADATISMVLEEL